MKRCYNVNNERKKRKETNKKFKEKIMKEDVKKKLIAKIIEQTEKFSKLNNYEGKPKAKKKPAKLSKKAEDIKRVIEDNDFGCADGAIARLVSIIIGEKIVIDEEEEENEDDVKFLSLCAVRCIGNDNGHSYDKTGREVLIRIINTESDEDDDDNESIFIDRDGELGNNLTSTKHFIIPATAEEIRKKVTQKQLDKVYGSCLIV